MQNLLSRRFIGTLLSASLLASTALAQDQDRDVRVIDDSNHLENIRSRSGLANFIAKSYGETGNNLQLSIDSKASGRNGVWHFRLSQKVDDLKVHGSYVKVAVGRQGKLTHLIEKTASTNGRRNKAKISIQTAMDLAKVATFGENTTPEFFYKPPRAEKVYIPDGEGNLSEGFSVETWSQDDNMLYYTLVDGDGGILDKELRTSQDSYNIYENHPGVSTQSVVSNPADPTASPSGWLSGEQSTLVIQGNNARAYLDRDNDNLPDGGGTVVTDAAFETLHFPLQAPTDADNQEASVQNLFYWNNFIHDDLYHHGFVEGTSNFQEDNFGKGGLGGDSVEAQAQDGGSTNNANFATPSDGFNPRMQMYIWTRSNPFRDSAIDTDIVWHEYGHGLTWRMIGSMSGFVSGAIGEGMSDVLAILHNNDDRVGEYSDNDPFGIRSEPYTNYGRTIGDFTGQSVHFDGEIYAATIWRLSELSNAIGVDNEALLDILVDAMNYTPAGPTYLDMRNGILTAIGEDSDYLCMAWQAFSDFGMGESAVFDISSGQVQITENFALPSNCSESSSSTQGEVLVDSLTGSPFTNGRNSWSATVTTTIKTPDILGEGGRPDIPGVLAVGVTVGGLWSTGDTGSCVTDNAGQCDVRIDGLSSIAPSIDYTVQTLNGDPAIGASTVLTVLQNPPNTVCTSCPPPRSLRRR